MKALTRQRCKKGTLRRAVLEAVLLCEAIGHKGVVPEEAHCGLCTNLYEAIKGAFQQYECSYQIVDAATELYKDCFMTWSKHSGDRSFPVPSMDMRQGAAQYYNRNRNSMYSGEYGELRLELARHVASELRKILEQ